MISYLQVQTPPMGPPGPGGPPPPGPFYPPSRFPPPGLPPTPPAGWFHFLVQYSNMLEPLLRMLAEILGFIALLMLLGEALKKEPKCERAFPLVIFILATTLFQFNAGMSALGLAVIVSVSMIGKKFGKQ